MSDHDPGQKTYTDIARAELAAFEWIGRRIAALAELAVDLAVAARARLQAWAAKTAADWRLFVRWLELATKAKGQGQHIEMAMTQSLLGASILNPFKFVSAVLGLLVVLLGGLLGWQFTRAEILDARVDALTEQNRTAVRSSWAWKERADANAKLARNAADAIEQNGRVRAAENDRSTELARATARRSAALAKRQRERIADAIATQSRDADGPVDLDRRLRDLAAPAGAAGDPAGAAAPGGDPAGGVPARADADAGAEPAAPASPAGGGGPHQPADGLLAGARPAG